jgi:hypothetical protein
MSVSVCLPITKNVELICEYKLCSALTSLRSLSTDAMVVQQGRLADKEKKLSKQDLLDTLRFGADKVFRSKDTGK